MIREYYKINRQITASKGFVSSHCYHCRNVIQDENKSECDKEEDADKMITPDTRKEDHTTPTRSGRNKSKDRQRKTSARSRRRGSAVSPPQVPTPASEVDRLVLMSNHLLFMLT